MSKVEYALKVMKKLRIEKGLTLQDVADGINYHTGKGYYDIESGRSKVRLEHLEKLSEFYKVPISVFFNDQIT